MEETRAGETKLHVSTQMILKITGLESPAGIVVRKLAALEAVIPFHSGLFSGYTGLGKQKNKDIHTA